MNRHSMLEKLKKSDKPAVGEFELEQAHSYAFI